MTPNRATLIPPGTLRLADLPAETLDWLETQRYDRIIEKHEGGGWEHYIRPGSFQTFRMDGSADVVAWDSTEFLLIAGRNVLLPLERESFPNLSLVRALVAEGGESLTIFLTDTTYEDEPWLAGRLAVCDKVPVGDFYLARVYHEWYGPHDGVPVRSDFADTP